MDLSLFNLGLSKRIQWEYGRGPNPLCQQGKRGEESKALLPQGPKKGGPREGEAQNLKSQNPTRAKKMEKKININEKTFKIEGN